MGSLKNNSFEALASSALMHLEVLIADTAEEIATEAQGSAPIDSGFLAFSIYPVTMRGSGRQDAMKDARKALRAKYPKERRTFLPPPNVSEVAIKGRPGSRLTSFVVVGAPYGLFVEAGTSRMAARPFFFQSIERKKSSFFAQATAILNGISGTPSIAIERRG